MDNIPIVTQIPESIPKKLDFENPNAVKKNPKIKQKIITQTPKLNRENNYFPNPKF